MSHIQDELQNTLLHEPPLLLHQVGHILGELAYKKYGNKSYSLCRIMFDMGCHHGVIEYIARKNGVKPEIFTSLFTSCNTFAKNPTDCIHPLGHGAITVSGNDIRMALSLCDSVYTENKTAWPCWRGAIMEFGFRPTRPITDEQQHNNPHAVCNTYDMKYQGACIQEYINYLTSYKQYSIKDIIKYCDSYTDTALQSACDEELGDRIALERSVDVYTVYTTCTSLSSRLRVTNCFRGMVIGYRASELPELLFPLCPKLPSEIQQLIPCPDR